VEYASGAKLPDDVYQHPVVMALLHKHILATSPSESPDVWYDSISQKNRKNGEYVNT
jgi:hypothetical protein